MITENMLSKPHWSRVGEEPRSGLALPLWSIHEASSRVNGDFGDLGRLIDGLGGSGIGMIQLLPINDLGMDSCPYSAVSAFALDPVYIAPELIPGFDASPKLKKELAALRQIGDGSTLDWPTVRSARLALLRSCFKVLWPDLSERCLAFLEENGDWLRPYLEYRANKALRDWTSWETWEGKLHHAKLKKEKDFLLFAQYVAAMQLEEVRRKADGLGILLVGDIPILVGRDSADVWANQEYFNLDSSAGAPPDMYALDGQTWGCPTYRWDVMRADGFKWWRARLAWAQRFYHIYRIDHVVGFFRIWTVPYADKTARNGRFVPAEEWTWEQHGRDLLQMMLESSTMLPIAEDLGTVPPVARKALAELGICGLKIQRWERNWDGDRRFIHPGAEPRVSTCSLSTHDSETALTWWRSNPGEAGELWSALYGGQAVPQDSAQIVAGLLASQAAGASVFCVQMLTDVLDALGLGDSFKEGVRINLPGTVGPHNWTWRCPVGVEELLPLLREKAGAFMRR